MSKLVWKTLEELGEEKTKPKPPSDQERLEQLEQALLILLMEGGEV